MKKLGMLGIIGGAALLCRPFRCNGRKIRYLSRLTALMPALRASIEGGHTPIGFNVLTPVVPQIKDGK
jgi:hypothetical protein